MKKLSLGYLTCCSILCLSMCTMGIFITKKREKILSRLFETYLTEEQWSTSFASPENLNEKVSSWEEMISELKRPLPLALSMPQVSDVLAWLSSHPLLNQEKNIEVTKVDYKLVKYPKLGESMEAYQAKVELEFTAFSLEAAEKFHEALLKGDSLVNPHKGIVWVPEQKNYRASFWLKMRDPK